jgi:hypothetical protein
MCRTRRYERKGMRDNSAAPVFLVFMTTRHLAASAA